MFADKLTRSVPQAAARFLCGLSTVTAVGAVFGLNALAAPVTYISLAVFTVLFYFTVGSKSIIATAVSSAVIIGSLIWSLTSDVDFRTLLPVYTAFCAVGWCTVWSGRRGGTLAVSAAVLFCAAIPSFFESENSAGVICAVVGLLIFFAESHPAGSREEVRNRTADCAAGITLAVTTVCLAALGFTVMFGKTGANPEIAKNIGKSSFFKGIGNYYSTFSVDELGMNFEDGTLGGPVENGDALIMTVKTDDPINLRCRVDNVYKSNRWSRSNPQYNYPYLKMLRGSDYRRIFCTELPRTKVPDGFFKDVEITVTPAGNMSNALAVPVRIDSVDFGQNDGTLIYNSLGEFFASRPVKNTYTVKARIPDTESNVFENWMEQNCDSFSKDTPEYEAVEKLYLDIPKENFESISEKTEEIMGGGSTYGRVRRLEQWLTVNMSYTRNPPDYVYSSDFIDNFLQSREGYCVHFATAMTVMLRTQGIPARYVTGYGISRTDIVDGTAKVTQKDAHAWCEVYFAGVGWIPFDPTASAGDIDTSVINPEENSSEEPQAGQTEPERKNAERNGADTPGKRPEGGTADRKEKNAAVPVIFIALPMILMYIYIVERRLAAAGRCSVASWHAIELALRACGYKRRDSETIREFVLNVCASDRRFSGCGLEEAADRTERAVYSRTGCDTSENGNCLEKLKAAMTPPENLKRVLLSIIK